MSPARALAIGALVVALQQPRAQQSPAAQPAAQQPPPTPTPAPPQFRTSINFVRVDVVASDKHGNPINDLQQRDFEVSEGNKLQRVDSFKLVTLDGGARDAIDEKPREIRTDFDEEREGARDDVRLFGIFLDDYHVELINSMIAREPLARFVERQLGPSDMVGIMYPLQSATDVRLTRNHAALEAALRQFKGRKSDYVPRNQAEGQYANYPLGTVNQIRNEVSLSAIRSLIVHLGSFKEGRKTLILVSEGYAGGPASGFFDMTSDLREVYSDANKFNVSIYAVDPRGLTSLEAHREETIDTLRVLSEQTGGRAIVNTNDLDAGMKQIVRDASAYYLLGYNSTQSPTDGRFHEITVKVKRPGVQIRARKGYWAYTPEEAKKAMEPPTPGLPKLMEAELAALTLPRGVIREWIGMSRGENGKTRVTFVWEPVSTARGDLTHDISRVSLTAAGPEGAAYFIGRIPDGRSSVSFDARPGALQLHVSVEGTSEILDTETREIPIPDLTSAQTAIGTPKVFKARTARDFQQLQTDGNATPTVGREFSRTDRILIRVPAYGPGDVVPTLTATLLNRGGQPAAGIPVTPPSAPGDDSLIDLPLSSLAPGEYFIEIKATGQGADARELVAFRVTG